MEDRSGLERLSMTTSVGPRVPSKPPAISIRDIAARMHERIKQVALEQEAVEDIKRQLEEQKNLIAEEVSQYQLVRREYLVQKRHSIDLELEYCQSQDEKKKFVTKTKELREKIKLMKEEMASKKRKWEEVVQTIVTVHQARIEIFNRSVAAEIKAYEMEKARRQEKIQRLTERAAFLEKERSRILEETAQAQADRDRWASSMEGDNAEIEALSIQVRHQLLQRASCRQALRQAQKALKSANDKVYELEAEYEKISLRKPDTAV